MSNQPETPVIDFLPDEHDYLTYIKKVIRHRCRQAGFRRISTSLFEKLETFALASHLSESEIEQNAVIMTDSKSKEKFVMRCDPVFSIARSYLTNNMKSWAQPVELYFIDAYLTRDGVMHDDVNCGVQVIGTSDAALTAQVIYLAHRILDDLGLREMYTVQINYIGSLESRKLFMEDLKNFYFDKQRSLCPRCLRYIELGEYLQLLRCEEEDCSILAQLAPKLQNYLNKQDQEHFENLKGYLAELEVSFRENKNLFGTGNYSAQTVFEFWHNDKGAKNTIIYGGSNDTLLEKLGGEKSTMIGFANNAKHLVEGMRQVGIRVPHKDNLQIFVAQLGVKAKKKALSLLQKLRESGIQAVGAMGTGSMRAQLDIATDFKVKYTLLMGEVEVNEGMVIVRDMKTGTQESVPYDHVIEIMQQRIGKEKMDVMEDDELSVDLKTK